MPRKKKTTEPNFAAPVKKPRRVAKKTTTNAPIVMTTAPSVGLYRKIAATFVVLTIVLAAAVVYFSLVSVRIVIYPNKERTTAEFTAQVRNEAVTNAAQPTVTGQVRGVSLTATDTFQATGKKTENVEVGGTVTIINNSSRNQPLAATTRLLSPDGKLFRIRALVQVPARSKVENVEVYADEPSKEMEIGPTKFTIPGLSQSAQELIYAESSAAMEYREQGDPVVTAEDIQKAREALRAKLTEELKTKEAEVKTGGYTNVTVSIDDTKVTYATDVDAGAEAAEFSMVATGTGAIIAFNTADVADLARLKIQETLPEGKSLSGFNEDNFTYAVERYSVENGVADLKVSAQAQMALNEDTEIIDPERLVGLNRAQLDDYLSGLREVAGYDVTFTPNWINKVPNLVDHVEVEVAE